MEQTFTRRASVYTHEYVKFIAQYESVSMAEGGSYLHAEKSTDVGASGAPKIRT